MAIYHLEAKVVSRGSGRSAVAAAAYMSCSAICNDYDGVQHDYTRKHGLVWQQVFLPPNAPSEWQDRAVLWNVVEAAEKSKDSRLAREFVAALPIDLPKEEWQSLITDFIQTQFVAAGMCADVAIHDTDGHNPHAHILLTVRPLDEKGKWKAKTQKEYLCIKEGEERGFTAQEFLAAEKDGWEKQYAYYVDKKKKAYLPPSRAEGLERADKHPKSTRYGRQNPISARWNSEEQLLLWRESWADCVNRFLEKNEIPDRIDHRSFTERGITEQPTIHEGVTARALEKQGILSDRCELNRQIREDNRILRTIAAQLNKLLHTVAETIIDFARTLEQLRAGMIRLRCHAIRAEKGQRQLSERVASMEQSLSQVETVSAALAAKRKEKQAVEAEKKATPVIRVLLHRDLTRRINGLSEDVEELKSRCSRLLAALHAESVPDIRKRIAHDRAAQQKLSVQQAKATAALANVLQEYAALTKRASDFDPAELYRARLSVRNEYETAAQAQLAAELASYQHNDFLAARWDIDLKIRDFAAAKQAAHSHTRQPPQHKRDTRER